MKDIWFGDNPVCKQQEHPKEASKVQVCVFSQQNDSMLEVRSSNGFCEYCGVGCAGLNYEAGIYGSLCGDLTSMLAVCETWEDAVWAHARCYLQLKAEKKVMAEELHRFNEYQVSPFTFMASRDTVDHHLALT